MAHPVLGRRSWLRTIWIAAVLLRCTVYRPAPLPTLLEAAKPPQITDEGSMREAVRSLGNPLLGKHPLHLADGFDPIEIGLIAAVFNPDLRAFRSQRQESSAELLTARIIPNPDLGFDLDRSRGSGSSGLRTAYRVTLSMGTRAALTRGSRIEAGRAHVREIDLSVSWREWQVAESARLEALRLGWIRKRLAIASEELSLQEETTATLEVALATGDVNVTQLGVQRTALASVRNAVADLERSEAETRGDLAALLGGGVWPDPIASVKLVDLPVARPALPVLLMHCLDRRLDLIGLRQAYAAQEARLRQAVLEQLPDIQIGLSQSRDETSLKFLGGLVSLGLPLFDRNQDRLAKEAATRERLFAEYKARVLRVRSTLRKLLGLLSVIDHRLPQLRASIQPLRHAETAQRRAVFRGDVDLLSSMTVRLGLLDQRLRVARLRQARAEAEAGIETACGGSFSAGVK